MRIYLPKPCRSHQLISALRKANVDVRQLVNDVINFREILLSQIKEDEEGRRFVDVDDKYIINHNAYLNLTYQNLTRRD